MLCLTSYLLLNDVSPFWPFPAYIADVYCIALFFLWYPSRSYHLAEHSFAKNRERGKNVGTISFPPFPVFPRTRRHRDIRSATIEKLCAHLQY